MVDGAKSKSVRIQEELDRQSRSMAINKHYLEMEVDEEGKLVAKELKFVEDGWHNIRRNGSLRLVIGAAVDKVCWENIFSRLSGEEALSRADTLTPKPIVKLKIVLTEGVKKSVLDLDSVLFTNQSEQKGIRIGNNCTMRFELFRYITKVRLKAYNESNRMYLQRLDLYKYLMQDIVYPVSSIEVQDIGLANELSKDIRIDTEVIYDGVVYNKLNDVGRVLTALVVAQLSELEMMQWIEVLEYFNSQKHLVMQLWDKAQKVVDKYDVTNTDLLQSMPKGFIEELYLVMVEQTQQWLDEFSKEHNKLRIILKKERALSSYYKIKEKNLFLFMLSKKYDECMKKQSFLTKVVGNIAKLSEKEYQKYERDIVSALFTEKSVARTKPDFDMTYTVYSFKNIEVNQKESPGTIPQELWDRLCGRTGKK